MKITVDEVLESAPSLANIGAVKVTTALKFRLGRVIKQAQEIVQDAAKHKKELLEREGTLNEKLGKYEFSTPEIEAQVIKEIEALGKEVVEIRFDKFTEKTLEPLEISSTDIANCLWLFTDNESKSDENVVE